MKPFEDPFSKVLQDLNKIAEQAGILNNNITPLSMKISAVNDIAIDIENLFVDVERICNAIKDTKSACFALTPIPIVGPIARQAGNVLDTASNTAIEIQKKLSKLHDYVNTFKTPIEKAKVGLDKLCQVLGIISSAVPSCVNTIKILDCLLQIAKPLAQVMKTQDVHNNLERLITNFDNIKSKVSVPLSKITPLISELLTSTNILISTVQNVSVVEDTIKKSRCCISNVADVLVPIKRGFDTVENAIAPLKWALNAAECVFNKVLKPVLNKVIEQTGLQSLVANITNELIMSLRIDSVFNEIEQQFNGDFLSALQNLNIDNNDNRITQMTNQWNMTNNALGEYSPSKNNNNKKAILDLLNAITNGEIDPDAPMPIFDWPSAPKFNNNDTENANAKQYHNLSMMINPQKIIPVIQTEVQTYDNLTVQRLSDAIQVTIDKLNKLMPSLSQLESETTTFYKKLNFPVDFETEVNIYRSYISFSVDLINFLADFKQFHNVLTPLKGVVSNQLDECNNLTNCINDLQIAVKALTTEISNSESHKPSLEFISSSIIKILSWADNAQNLFEVINSGNESTPNPEQVNKLNSYSNELSITCNDLEDLLGKINNTIDEITSNITTISEQLASYLYSLNGISENGILIPNDGVNKAVKIATTLSTIDSIFDPLSVLLDLEGCKKSHNNIIEFEASNALQVIQNAGANFITNNGLVNIIETLLNELANNILPTGKLYTEISIVTQNLNKSITSTINDQVTQLGVNLDTLMLYLNNSKSYVFTNDKGIKFNADNQFVADDVAREAVLLSHEFAGA